MLGETLNVQSDAEPSPIHRAIDVIREMNFGRWSLSMKNESSAEEWSVAWR